MSDRHDNFGSDKGSDGEDYEREALMNSFIKSVIRGKNPDTFFDEDDLVEIFDYASDLPDDNVRFEVLLYAARMFPDSVPLLERRAWLYLDMNINAPYINEIICRLPDDSVMKQLLEIAAGPPDKELIQMALERILATTTDFEDEWMIRLVETASNVGCFDWLKSHYKELRARTSYPQTLIYELIENAEIAGDYEFAATLAEELTMLEPFNVEFWEMLAELRLNHLNDQSQAVVDIDYALAINPESVRALLLKGRALFELDRPISEVQECFAKAHKIEPDNPLPIHNFALTILQRGNATGALAVLESFREEHPDDIDTIEFMIIASKSNIDKSIITEAMSPDNVLAFAECANRLIHEKIYDGALLIYDRIVKLTTDYDPTIYVELLYRNKRYNDILTFVEKHKDMCTDALIDLAWVLSRLHLGKTDNLQSDIMAIINKHTNNDDYQSFKDKIYKCGIFVPMTSIKLSLDNGDAFNPKEFDPFI